jgi:hypothetical protein
MAELTDGDKQLFDDIEKYGLHVPHILGDDENPRFSFSVGLYKTYQHPEIIIIGLKQELSHTLINNIAEDIKNGKRYDAFEWSNDILTNYNCLFIPVDKLNYEEYMGYANWYYNGNNYPLLQCIYPTVKGVYPWEDTWPGNIKKSQPILGEIENPNQL